SRKAQEELLHSGGNAQSALKPTASPTMAVISKATTFTRSVLYWSMHCWRALPIKRHPAASSGGGGGGGMGLFADVWANYKETGNEAAVHRVIAANFRHADEHSSVLQAFADELETFVSATDVLLLMLSVGLGGIHDTQHSFLGILLREDVVQPKIVEVLLEKLSEFAVNMDDASIHRNIPKLILREIRWIDHVVQASSLVEKLLGTLPAFPVAVQAEIIYLLPEIASDDDNRTVVDALLELMKSEANLVGHCIEALGNFNVVNDQTDEVIQCVTDRLSSAALTDLPVIVKYLVLEAPIEDFELMLAELIEKLSTIIAFSAHDTSAMSQPARSRRAGLENNKEALILGGVVQGFYVRDELMKAFLTRMKAAKQQESDLQMFEVWMLFGAHSIATHRDKTEKLVRAFVQSGQIGSSLLQQAIKGHADALRSYFPSILQLASVLVSLNDAKSASVGGLLYELLFDEFSPEQANHASDQVQFYRGEVRECGRLVALEWPDSNNLFITQIVTGLLQHCLSKNVGPADVALKTLEYLVSGSPSYRLSAKKKAKHIQRRERFRVFLPLLKQMIDMMDFFSSSQVRDIYNLLFAIGGSEDPDLCNAVRKQSFHQDARFQLMGIIGAIARLQRMLRHLAETSGEFANDDTESNDIVMESEPLSQPQATERVAVTLNKWLMELHDSSFASSKSFQSMLAELTHFVEKLDMDNYETVMVGIISDFYTELLLSTFVEDCDTKKPDSEYTKVIMNGSLKSELCLRLDKVCMHQVELRSPVYLKIMDLVVSDDPADRESLMILSPLVTLLMVCARKLNKLSEIECVLVCPIQLPEKSIMDDFAGLDSSVQNAVCCAFWHAINWIRSLVNFFVQEKADYYVQNTTKRLHDLLDLEKTLVDECVVINRTFTAPSESGMVFAAAATPIVKKRGRPPKSEQHHSSASLTESFVPLKTRVVDILAFPVGLQGVHDSSTSKEHRGGLLTQKSVCFLLQLLRQHVELSESALKQTRGFAWAKPSGGGPAKMHESYQTPAAIFSHAMVMGVFRAAGKFATIVLSGLPTQAEAEDDEQAIPTVDPLSLSLLEEYLRLAAKVIEIHIDQSSSIKATPALTSQLQALLLPDEAKLDPITIDSVQMNEVSQRSFKKLMEFRRALTTPAMAVDLLNSLTALVSFSYGFNAKHVLRLRESLPLNDQCDSLGDLMASRVSKLARKILQQDWSHGDPKFLYKKADIEVFLRCYLHYNVNVLGAIQDVSIQGFLLLAESNGKAIESYPTLTKKTVAIYHRVMMETLVTVLSRVDYSGGANDTALLLNVTLQTVLLFKLLVCMSKGFQKSSIVGNILKGGKGFIEAILHAMPFFQENFRFHHDKIITVITELQVATRRIQVLCAHGKLVKDPTAASQVPTVKRLLEKLIYKGEELAKANGVLDAYTTGLITTEREKKKMETTTKRRRNSPHKGARPPKAEFGGSNLCIQEASDRVVTPRGHAKNHNHVSQAGSSPPEPLLAAESKRGIAGGVAQFNVDAECFASLHVAASMKNIIAAKVSVIRKRSQLTSSTASNYEAAGRSDVVSTVPQEPSVHHGKMHICTGEGTSATEQVVDVVLCVSIDAVHAVTEVGNTLVFEARFARLKEIIWDHSEKSLRFTMDDNSSSDYFVFPSLKEVETKIVAATQDLAQRPEQIYVGVLIGKNLPSPIQQRRASGVGLADAQHPLLPTAKRRELLLQERPARNTVGRDRLGLDYIHNGYLVFTCSINGDVRSIKLDMYYVYVFPSPDCHDRSACLFSYTYDTIESCESMGTRLELRFRRSGTKQPTYLAFQSLEAQYIRDAIWYLKTGVYMDVYYRQLSLTSSGGAPGANRQPSTATRRHSIISRFQDEEALRQRIESRCLVIGCHGQHEPSLTSSEHSSRHEGMGQLQGFCPEHTTQVSSPRSPSKRSLFTREKSIQLIPTLHSKHYARMLRYQGQLTKKGGKFQLTKNWNPKFAALFETPVGGFLCYYDKQSHCPGIAATPKERRVIDLSSVICIRPESTVANAPKYAFDIVTLYRNWTFAAPDAEEYEVWLQVLADAVEKHTSIAPDKRLKYAVKVTLDPGNHFLPRHENSATLEITAHGVTILTGSDGDSEVYSWYFTEIQKWSVVLQHGDVCCLLSCLSMTSADSNLGYHDFIFQTPDASNICHAIEFYVGKCMAKLEMLSIGYIEGLKRSWRSEMNGTAHELVSFRSEQVLRKTSAATSLPVKQMSMQAKLGSPPKQHLVSAVSLAPINTDRPAVQPPPVPATTDAHEVRPSEQSATVQEASNRPSSSPSKGETAGRISRETSREAPDDVTPKTNTSPKIKDLTPMWIKSKEFDSPPPSPPRTEQQPSPARSLTLDVAAERNQPPPQQEEPVPHSGPSEEAQDEEERFVSFDYVDVHRDGNEDDSSAQKQGGLQPSSNTSSSADVFEDAIDGLVDMRTVSVFNVTEEAPDLKCNTTAASNCQNQQPPVHEDIQVATTTATDSGCQVHGLKRSHSLDQVAEVTVFEDDHRDWGLCSMNSDGVEAAKEQQINLEAASEVKLLRSTPEAIDVEDEAVVDHPEIVHDIRDTNATLTTTSLDSLEARNELNKAIERPIPVDGQDEEETELSSVEEVVAPLEVDEAVTIDCTLADEGITCNEEQTDAMCTFRKADYSMQDVNEDVKRTSSEAEIDVGVLEVDAESSAQDILAKQLEDAIAVPLPEDTEPALQTSDLTAQRLEDDHGAAITEEIPTDGEDEVDAKVNASKSVTEVLHVELDAAVCCPLPSDGDEDLLEVSSNGSSCDPALSVLTESADQLADLELMAPQEKASRKRPSGSDDIARTSKQGIEFAAVIPFPTDKDPRDFKRPKNSFNGQSHDEDQEDGEVNFTSISTTTIDHTLTIEATKPSSRVTIIERPPPIQTGLPQFEFFEEIDLNGSEDSDSETITPPPEFTLRHWVTDRDVVFVMPLRLHQVSIANFDNGRRVPLARREPATASTRWFSPPWGGSVACTTATADQWATCECFNNLDP
ncbi:TPA: hypothetical protein N0F65_000985, partial [Lagenidium giganteum]